MAMTTSGMSAAILAQLTAASPISTPAQLANAIATAVVTYIQSNAVVPALGLIAPAGGGPVTGAAVVT